MFFDTIAKECTGCTACKSICPRNCISFVKDFEGFPVPGIRNQEECIHCGLCEKVCPVVNNHITAADAGYSPSCYMAWAKDRKIRKSSSSGGIFPVLAASILKEQGKVAGCYLDRQLKARHIIINQPRDIGLLTGSKYIQSDLNGVFRSIQGLLNEEQTVMFSGTPCQIAGLKSFLKKDYDRLYTVDLVCHGVPSPGLFAQYIEWENRKFNKKLHRFSFRDKGKCGWSLTNSFYADGKKIYQNASTNPYYYGFTEGYTYRECCYQCRYTGQTRTGDITLGDYWGAEEDTSLNTYDGISLMMINNRKGEELFHRIEDALEYRLSDFAQISRRNGNLLRPTERPHVRDVIYKELGEKGFAYIADHYLTPKRLFIEKLKFLIPVRFKIIYRKYRKKFRKRDISL